MPNLPINPPLAGGPAAPGPSPKRLVSPPAARRKVIVTIGIDFGTSQTKVLFRSDEPKAKSVVCLFEDNPAGYPPIGLPSTVRIVSGKVYFAADAERRSGGIVYRSFKTCLRCKLINEHCAHCEAGPHRRSPGHRALPDGEGAVPPDELAAWYLAYVIAQLSARVRSARGVDVRLMFNIAAPMDALRTGQLYYERTAFLAERLAQTGDVDQGMDLERLRFLYHQLEADNPELPAEGERSSFVVAESAAGVYAYVQSPAAEDGLYALIDIGAGTTDMSIFRYSVDRLMRDSYLPHFYSAAVCHVGADRVDRSVFDESVKRGHLPRGLGESMRADWLGLIRIAKQQDEDGAKVRRQMGDVIPPDVYQSAAAAIGAELFSHYKRDVFVPAYYVEADYKHWQNLTMFLIGGGSSLVGLATALDEDPWPPHIPGPRIRRLQLPDGLGWDGGATAADRTTRYHQQLMVAYGLSFPYAAVSAFTPPDGRPQLEIRRPPLRPDWDIGPFDPGS
jgi:hypothetical protein